MESITPHAQDRVAIGPSPVKRLGTWRSMQCNVVSSFATPATIMGIMRVVGQHHSHTDFFVRI